MKVKLFNTCDEMGKASAEHAARILNEIIARDGEARLLLSTGASQFPFFKYMFNVFTNI